VMKTAMRSASGGQQMTIRHMERVQPLTYR
jgi:hypothetical protein